MTKKHYLDYLILMLWREHDIVQKEDISRLTKKLNKIPFYDKGFYMNANDI